MGAAPAIGRGRRTNGAIGTPAEPIAVDSVLDLFTHTDDPERKLPVVIVSIAWNASRHGVPPRRLASELAGRATVWVLADAAASRLLDGREDLATYGGAVRVVGADGWSAVIRTNKAPGDPAINRVKDAVATALSTAGRPASRPTLRLANEPHTAAAGDDGEVDDGEVWVHIEQLQDSVLALQRQVDELRAQEPDTTLEQSEPTLTTRLFADDADQLRHDLQQTWLRQVPECDRSANCLRGYRLGDRFLDGLKTVTAPRDRVLTVLVDVLTRRAYSMPARAVHPHGTHRGGPQLTRDDGGRAYRATVKDGTPGAPRLLWWELVDGTVELAWAGHHDDPMP